MVDSDVLDGLVGDMCEGTASSSKVRRTCQNTLSDAKKMGAAFELPSLADANSAGDYGKLPGNIDRAAVAKTHL